MTIEGCWDGTWPLPSKNYRNGYSDPKLEEKRRKAIDWLRKGKGWVLDIRPQRLTGGVPSAGERG